MKFAKGAICITAVLLLAAGIAAALTPALARPAASSSWAGRIPAQQTESGEKKLSLFEKERQTVLLGAQNGEFEIPLEPNAGEYRVTDPGDGRWVKVQLAEDGSALRAKSYLDQMLTADEPQPGDTTQVQTTEETAEQTTKAEKSEPEGTVAEPAAEEETTAPPTEQDETPAVRPDGISFTVVCTDADGTEKEASFVLAASAEYTLQGTVLLEKEQYLYAKEVRIPFTVGQEDAVLHCNNAPFPAGTVYEENGERFVLYTAQPLRVGAGSAVLLDFSKTSVETALFFTGAEQSKTLEYYPMPSFSTEQAFVMGESGMIVPVPYAFGTAKASAKTTRTEARPNGTVRVADDTITYDGYAATGELRLTPHKTPAGAYTAQLLWQWNGYTLYEAELPFCVCYESAAGAEAEAPDIYRYAGDTTPLPTDEGTEIEITVSYYCSCSICCGEWANGITASGKRAASGMVAMAGEYPFGTKIEIDGVLYTVQDRGGKVTGNHVDIYAPTHTEALRRSTAATTAIVYLPPEQ